MPRGFESLPFHKFTLKFQAMMRDIAVIDIDGTLCVVGDRRKFIEQSPPDWAAFYASSFDDRPITAVCDLVRQMALCYDLIFCTSRRESVRQRTQIWLERHLGMPPRDYTLIMRPDDDRRPDVQSKIERFKLETTPEERGSVAFVIEDSVSMAAAWRRAGYKCFQVS